LARHLHALLPDATFWGRAEADLSHPEMLQSQIEQLAPIAIINAAAHTAVDRAESERDLAWRINAEAPAAMARAAAALGAPLVHVSTDYVFDGFSSRPYVESDPVAPLNTYGVTKLGGELAVRSLAPRHWILRTSWVFSEHGTNFVKTMLRLGKDRDNLKIVDDQCGRPTYAGDLAQLIVALLSQLPNNAVEFGTYHTGGNPAVTWRDFALAILGKAHALAMIPKVPLVQGIPTSQYPTPARRPLNSTLAPNAHLHASTGITFDWQAGLDLVLSRIEYSR
jgi:dTDP-4-dehydrorhamnose reductase